MRKPQQAQEPGASPADSIPTSPGSGAAPPAAAAPRFCVSCGGPLLPFGSGETFYCDKCEHVFDKHGQGRPADFKDQLARMRAEIAGMKASGMKDPRVDKLDEVVAAISMNLTGKKAGIADLDPKNPEQMGKLSMAMGMLKSSFGAFFTRRPAPKPATPPAPGAGK